MSNQCSTNPDDENELLHQSRRKFLKRSTAAAAISMIPAVVVKAAENQLDEKAAGYFEQVSLSITVNNVPHQLNVEPRVSLLDLL